jgi:hypothetical protein
MSDLEWVFNPLTGFLRKKKEFERHKVHAKTEVGRY